MSAAEKSHERPKSSAGTLCGAICTACPMIPATLLSARCNLGSMIEEWTTTRLLRSMRYGRCGIKKRGLVRLSMMLYMLQASAILAWYINMTHASCPDMSDLSRVDVHSHFVPPFWREASIEYGYGQPDGMPEIPPWTEEEHLNTMAQANISKSIISITSPGTNLVLGNNTVGRDITRRCNEFAADLKRRRPDKFGFWASLPLPDVEGSLTELAYALDKLNADGIAVETNAHGVYLGDESLAPVFEELNRRNAKIFVHPTSPCVKGNATVQQAAPLTRYPNPMFEFFFDTARATINLFVSGTMKKCPNLTIILPHAGGALPPLIDRFSNFASLILGGSGDVDPETVKATLKRQFYFDLAGFVFPDQIYGLLRYVNASRILYGSDYPYTPAASVINLASVANKGLKDVFPEPRDQIAILRENAVELLRK